jgi:formylmethanofuran dehydrogenase subunit C
MDGGRGGLVLRVDGELRFLPATLAARGAPTPRVTTVPGAPPDLLGIAMHEGTIVPVVAIGALRGDMVVCQHAGELVGLVGGEVVRAGRFEAVEGRADLVQVDGQLARQLDVGALYARVQTGGRPARGVR